MSKLYLLQYNNYLNRIKKGYATIEQYAPFVVDFFSTMNFNPADGVDTSHVLQTSHDDADYLIVTSDDNAILSRWFILDCDRTRAGQYRYTLHRDTVYDKLASFFSSVAYLDKGWIDNVDNPLIYNEEGIATNVIKRGETMLWDKSQTPWIVGYLTRAGEEDDETEEGRTIEWSNEVFNAVDITAEQFYFLAHSDAVYRYSLPESYTIQVATNNLDTTGFYRSLAFNDSTSFDKAQTMTIQGTVQFSNSSDIPHMAAKLIAAAAEPTNKFAIRLAAIHQLPSMVLDYSAVADLAGKPLYYNGHFYNLTLTPNTGRGISVLLSDTDYLSLRRSIANIINANQQFPHTPTTVTEDVINGNVYYELKGFDISFQEISVGKYKVVLPPRESMYMANKQPYAIFAMPYSNTNISGQTGLTVASGAASMAIAQGISAKFTGSSRLIDLQLLPYCPFSELISPHRINVSTLASSQKLVIQYTSDNETWENKGILLFAVNDTVRFDIVKSVPDLAESDSLTYKVSAQTKRYRLVSPNYSGAFEFSAHKCTKADQLTFRIDCTFKPYNPYIHICPVSDPDSLYGGWYGDSQGLICGGDFSLPQISDAWQTYQIQNKNYEASFDRQIRSQELQNKYAKISDITQAVTGTLSGGFMGAAMGVGPVSRTIGAIAGGVASAIGGAADVYVKEKLRQENISLQKDLFNFNLQNIQALPQTLAKVGALTANNKLYPFIEEYDCTDVEKNALINKIKYNGMTLGIVSDNVSQYVRSGERSWLQGMLIRIECDDDYHFANSIREELMTGFFINKGGT